MTKNAEFSKTVGPFLIFNGGERDTCICLVCPQQVSLMKKYIVLTIKILGGPEIGGPMLKLFSLIENPHLVLSATLSRPYCVTLLRKTLY